MKKLVTTFLAGILFFALAFSTGCVKYHAKIGGLSKIPPTDWKLRDDLPEVHTQDTCYPNPDYDPNYKTQYNENGEVVGKNYDEYLYCGLEYPREVIVVIDSQEKLEARYEKYPEYDFSKHMFITYYFTATNDNRRTVTDVELENGELTIYWKERRRISSCGRKNARMPFTTSFTVWMDKVEFETIKFKEVY